MTNPVHYINRESDGHTYWHTDDGWMAAPTQTDDTPDLDCESYVVDFEEYMAPKDYAELTAWLRTKVCEGGDGCGAPPSVRPYLVVFGSGEGRDIQPRNYCDDCAHLIRRGWLPEVKLVEERWEDIEGGAA
jgi:hypothetical protein